jgi:O-antigen/teichoic acid export membrane protein
MLVISLIAARVLGVDSFGLFVSLQAVGLFSAAIWDLGFSSMITREVAAGAGEFAPLFREALCARLWFLPFPVSVYIIGCAVVGIHGNEEIIAGCVVLAGALANGLSILLNAGLQGQLRFNTSALTMAAGRLVSVCVALFIALGSPDFPLVGFAIGYLLGELAVLALQLRAATLPVVHLLHPFQVTMPLAEVRRALPYAYNGFFTMVYNRMDVVLVSIFAGSYQSGLYAPASRIQDALMLMPTTASAAVVPLAARRFGLAQEKASFRRTGVFALALSVGLTLPPLIVTFFAAESLVPLALGPEFADSASSVQVILWSLVFIAIAQPVFSLMVAAGEVRRLNVAYGTGLVVALLGHALLDPPFGSVGGACVAVVRDAAVCGVGAWVALNWYRSNDQEKSVHEPRPSLKRGVSGFP